MLFRPALIVMIAGILLIPLFGQSSLVPAALVKTGYTCFELIVWIILGYLCQRMKLSPVLTFGFGRSLIAASGFVGSIAAYALRPSCSKTLCEQSHSQPSSSLRSSSYAIPY